MELFLIRHGETVDNVAGLYAGSRNSSLTNHGVEQARRLGEHFARAEVDVCFDYIFASPLSRAFKTAQAIQTAQLAASTKAPRAAKGHSGSVEIVRVPELVEQDFGLVPVPKVLLGYRLLTAEFLDSMKARAFSHGLYLGKQEKMLIVSVTKMIQDSSMLKVKTP